MQNNITFFLAQFWGWLLVIINLLYLLNKKLIKKILKFEKQSSFLFISGWIALILGLTTIILHNKWKTNWTILITIFGWISLLKGIFFISFPKKLKINKKLLKNELLTQILLLTFLILGIFLVVKSFSL